VKHLKWPSVIILSFILAACSSGTNPSSPNPPPSSRIARIEITPLAALLTDAGQAQQFSAQAFDASGNPIEATFTWRSSNAQEVGIDQSGQATSLAEVGSAQISVEAEGVRAPPATVLIAQPAEGAVLLTDAQIVRVGEALDAAEVPGVGSQYEATLRDTVRPAFKENRRQHGAGLRVWPRGGKPLQEHRCLQEHL
jgi:hypothetical protein